MSANKIFNIVVIGVGTAGRVRIRDLKEGETSGLGLRLAGFVSRRTLEIEGTRQVSMDEALQDPDVDGVAVCTEPGSHEDTIATALRHNKHVLVEYPVASTPEKAKELYTLAEEKGLVLHEENIALLTDSFSNLKEKVKSSPPLKSGTITLKGNFNGWVEDFTRSGLPFTTNVSVIQTVISVFGAIQPVTASLSQSEAGFVATGEVRTNNGAIIKLTSERYKEKVSRVKQLKFQFEDGSEFDSEDGMPPRSDPEVKRKKGLFMQDLIMFVEKLKGDRPRSEGSNLSVEALDVAVKLNQFIKLEA